MLKKDRISRIMYITGVVALIAGALDPLEGSVIILAGSSLLTIATNLTRDRHRNIFLIAFLMIAAGVLLMFWLSSRGGIGGTASLSWWWGLLVIPYPVGWLITVILLIIRTIKKKSLTDIR
ncbi:MAG: hypothetical protein RBU28_02610 [Bacteroidales bacterium]|jgi:apolipoprotein N-acyltransferase|nr:hypothetical protein [Bacteroidales bacterium]